MISEIHIENFKCFDDLRLPLAPLTLLAGFNGGGKSTALQPLLLLSQGFATRVDPVVFPLNGVVLRLGSGGDILPASAVGSNIGISIRGHGGEATWRLNATAGDRHLNVVEFDERYESDGPSLSRQLEDLIFLSAVRVGPDHAYPQSDNSDSLTAAIGNDGRFAADWYSRLADEEVDAQKRHPEEPASSFRKQLDAWLGSLFPNAQANVQAVPQVGQLSLEFRLSDIGPWRKPANIGYGLTYCFPILVALLAARPGQLVVVDSPEAHLHPSAQSAMGRLLSHFAAAGVQIIAETHSDHLLSGARLAVKTKVLKPNEVALHFFTGAVAGQHGVISPNVDADGRVDEWPEGFFDQTDKDLSLLTGWN